jgi:hypothetical protein
MPTRSPGDAPAATIRELGLPGRAVTALTRAGVVSVADLAVLTGQDLAAITGLGPGMTAAIRLVVPEPPTSVARSRVSPDTDHEEAPFPAIDPEHEPAEEESRAAPVIPSFDSLRAQRRRSAVDLLVPGPPPVPSATPAARAGVPRPAEYADLLRLGARAVHAVAAVPVRVAWWSVREPVHCLRRLLGGWVGAVPAATGGSRPDRV